MAYNTYNNGFPVTYIPASMPMVNMPYQSTMQPMQYSQMMQPNNQQNMQMQQQIQPNQQLNQQQNYQTMNNSSQMNQQSDPQLPMPTVGGHGVSTTDIIWVTDDQEVIDYPIGTNNTGIFMDLNRMKMYTKEGATGLIRDFELIESPESIQRYQQMKQIQNAQFPVVDATATVVDSEMQNKQLMDDIEQKIEQRFNSLEQKIGEMVKSVGSELTDTSTTATTTVAKKPRSMKK